MNHPRNDELLLLAYGELAEPAAGQIEAHVATCLACQAQLAGFERGRLALDAQQQRSRAWSCRGRFPLAIRPSVGRPRRRGRRRPDM